MSSATTTPELHPRPKASAPSNCSLWQPAINFTRKSGAWWEGRRVRLERQIITRGGDVYRKGRIAKVARKYGGLTLEGRRLYVTGVGYYKLSVDATENSEVSGAGATASNDETQSRTRQRSLD